MNCFRYADGFVFFIAGTLFISDRNVYFVTKTEVMITPIHAIDYGSIELCTDEGHGQAPLHMKKAQHSLRIPASEIRCISLDDDDDDAGSTHSRVQAAFASLCGKQTGTAAPATSLPRSRAASLTGAFVLHSAAVAVRIVQQVVFPDVSAVRRLQLPMYKHAGQYA